MKLKRHLIIIVLLSTLFTVNISYAELVVPGGSQEGNSNTGIPFNVTDSIRYQEIFAASEFSAAAGPIKITGISYRLDRTFGNNFTSTVAPFQIDLSTSPLTVLSISNNFALNVGTDNIIVRSLAPQTLSGIRTIGGGATPNPFDIFINFDTPFIYDPSDGDLLIDIKKQAGGQVASWFDANTLFPVSGTNWSTNLSDTTGSAGPFKGLVTQFHTLPVPGPSLELLLGISLIGLVGVGAARKSKNKAVASS